MPHSKYPDDQVLATFQFVKIHLHVALTRKFICQWFYRMLSIDVASCSRSFPASCPYVVAVGATQGPESKKDEIACSSETGGIVTSGGGFSSIFKQPPYQKDAVEGFFKNSDEKDLPPKDQFHSKGRAYPDVSLLGYNYIIVDGGQFSAESGTSASAPVFAAMLSLINGELLAAGKPPVGFINPL